MRASVIIRTRNEAARLRLTLASLAGQTATPEIVVVNDGSTDDTAAVVAEAARRNPLIAVHHEQPQGREASSNEGAMRAGGDILIFLDGDTLMAPDCVARHLAVHASTPDAIVRGETYHLRCTRFLADPETGTPMPGATDRIGRTPQPELARMRVTRHEITTDFASIHRRAECGIYPGAGPRRLYEVEMAALRDHKDCPVLWEAASGANQSVNAAAFRASGGFDNAMSINAHREFALRLCRAGLRMAPAGGARSYHMNHRSGWRDPLNELDWERHFYKIHPLPEVALLAVFWRSLTEAAAIPPAARILSLPALAAAASRCAGISGIASIRAAHLASCALQAA